MPVPSVSPRSKNNALPPRQATRSSLTLVLVVTSGLVLTALSVVILHLALKDNAAKRTEIWSKSVHNQVSIRFDRMVREIRWAAGFLARDLDLRELEHVLRQVSGAGSDSTYDQIVRVSTGPTHQIERVISLRENPDRRLMATLQDQVVRRMDAKKTADLAQMHIFFLDTPAAAGHEDRHKGPREYRVQYRYFGLVLPLVKDGQVTGYIAGIAPFSRLMDFETVVQSGYQGLISIDWNAKDSVLSVAPMGESLSSGRIIRTSFRLLMQDMILAVSLRDARWGASSFLPYTLPLIGLIITFLGGLYVRNNQNQAVMLTKMNKILALKNMEMNSQVTERERLNQTLRKTEQEKRAIMDSVSDIIFEIDHDGKIHFLNDTWRRITGFSVDQSLGQDFFDLMPSGSRDEHRKGFQEILMGQKHSAMFKGEILSAGDTYRQMQIRYSMIRMDENNNPHVVGTMTDIEESRRAESALAEAEEKYRAIWEHAVTGIYQATVEGQLISANPVLARIFGYSSPDEMIGDVGVMHRQLYASVKDRQSVLNTLMDLGRVSNVEVQGVRRDGTHFWMNESTRLVRDANGQVAYLEGSIDDITERKQAELQLKFTMTELELASRSKTEFLANMSHELRTPLNAIIGFSEIIKDEVFGPLEQRQYHDYACDIHDSGKHLLGIINTILDVSRIEAGERQLNETSVDIPRVVRDTVELVRLRAEENMLTFSFDIPTSLPKLWAEELAIKQILLNLMTNAVKFTPAGGRIAVSAQIDETGELRLSVSDTGIGLDDEEIERVMAPFGQASGSFSRSSSGPGLGLTLVNSLIRLHGGHFEMISQKGVGTTATAILPASRLQK